MKEINFKCPPWQRALY